MVVAFDDERGAGCTRGRFRHEARELEAAEVARRTRRIAGRSPSRRPARRSSRRHCRRRRDRRRRGTACPGPEAARFPVCRCGASRRAAARRRGAHRWPRVRRQHSPLARKQLALSSAYSWRARPRKLARIWRRKAICSRSRPSRARRSRSSSVSVAASTAFGAIARLQPPGQKVAHGGGFLGALPLLVEAAADAFGRGLKDDFSAGRERGAQAGEGFSGVAGPAGELAAVQVLHGEAAAGVAVAGGDDEILRVDARERRSCARWRARS